MNGENKSLLTLSPDNFKKLANNLKKSLKAYKIFSLDYLDDKSIAAIIATLLVEAVELGKQT